MRLRGPDDNFGPSARAVSSDRAGLSGSLMFLGFGYLLIVASPFLSSRLSSALQNRADFAAQPWLPAAAAAGVALIGASAMMLVLARLVRDVEERPYASIAPVLTVFTGFILMGLRAKLPFEGLASEHLGVFALSLSLCGGALVCRDSILVRVLGWLLALMPPFAITYAIAIINEHGDVDAALRRADPQVRVYLILLALSSVALALVGVVARVLARGSSSSSARASAHITDPSMPRLLPPGNGYGSSLYAGAEGYGQQYGQGYGAYDDSYEIPTRRDYGKLVALGLLALGIAGFGTYHFFVLPQRARIADLTPANPVPTSGSAIVLPSAAQAAAPAPGTPSVLELSPQAPAAPAAAAAPGMVVGPIQQMEPKQPEPAPAAAPMAPAAPAAPAAVAAAVVAPSVPAEPPKALAKPAAKPIAVAKPAKVVKAPARLAAKVAPAPKSIPAKAAVAAAVPAEPPAKAKKPADSAVDELEKLAASPAKATKPAKVAAPEPEPKAVEAKPAKPSKAVSQNSADLDLDQLVEKAMKGGGKSKGGSFDASNDPILGL